ncbi:hypothetical protein SCHPADRAFT_948463 [Schizopora paradoxa]|uniref:Uncharacterized protein n=1 Tax=Schizopora paradoxa TaxID=27342 RepID=A0A0H2R2H2_9AGAM|nr:hypothetical protein SCHPADRAFT_948463 [Schizopora paradoxa]
MQTVDRTAERPYKCFNNLAYHEHRRIPKRLKHIRGDRRLKSAIAFDRTCLRSAGEICFGHATWGLCSGLFYNYSNHAISAAVKNDVQFVELAELADGTQWNLPYKAGSQGLWPRVENRATVKVFRNGCNGRYGRVDITGHRGLLTPQKKRNG